MLASDNDDKVAAAPPAADGAECEGDACALPPRKAGATLDAARAMIRELVAADSSNGLPLLMELMALAQGGAGDGDDDGDSPGQRNAELKVGDLLPKLDTSSLAVVRGKTDIAIGGGGAKQATVVEFWASWCPPCKRSIPHLSEMQARYADKNVFFVGITDEDLEETEAFVRKMADRMAYTVAVDTKGEANGLIYRPTGGQGIPHAVVVGVDNRILFVGHPMDRAFEKAVAKAAEDADARAEADIGIESKMADGTVAESKSLKVGDLLPKLDASELLFVRGKSDVSIGGEPADSKQATVVEAWATWCPPCRDTIPHLGELQAKYKDRNVFFVGITNERPQDEVAGFVRQMGRKMAYTVAIDKDLKAREAIFEPSGMEGIPHAIVAGTDNRILFIGHPMDDEFEEAVAKAAADAGPREPADEGIEDRMLIEAPPVELPDADKARKMPLSKLIEVAEAAGVDLEIAKAKEASEALKAKLVALIQGKLGSMPVEELEDLLLQIADLDAGNRGWEGSEGSASDDDGDAESGTGSDGGSEESEGAELRKKLQSELADARAEFWGQVLATAGDAAPSA